MLACVTIAVLQLSGCSPDAVTGLDQPTTEVGSSPAHAGVQSAASVPDLRVASVSAVAATLSWTEVDDGTGRPASYRLKYQKPTLEWGTATTACTVSGHRTGDPISCVVPSLDPETTYDFELMSYRVSNGQWVGAVYSNVATGRTAAEEGRTVTDLAVTAATSTTLTVRWTEVDDGTGDPSAYRVKYSTPPIRYGAATIGCDRTISGVAIGARMSCTIEGLKPETAYDLQLESFRVENGAWVDARPSNVASAQTSSPAVRGIWISPSDLAALPTSGPAWDEMKAEADSSCGVVDLTDQNQMTNVCILAKALVFARTAKSSYRSDVVTAIREIVDAPPYSGRALSLGRKLAAYVVSADLIGLPGYDATLDRQFRAELRELLTTPTTGAAANLVECHERRANNWGTMCGGTRAAIAAYLGDTTELARVARVFKGFLGDRSAYAGFKFGEDLSWQCDPTRPVPVNPAGCTRYGRDLDGVVADDQRRGGSFTWPPFKENYVWENLQGAVTQAVILERAGYPAFQWGTQALRRAVHWLHSVDAYPARGDDTWVTQLINHYYGTSFPVPTPTRPGKIMGWTDWTHPS